MPAQRRGRLHTKSRASRKHPYKVANGLNYVVPSVRQVQKIVRKEIKKTEETKFFKYATEFELTAGGTNHISYNLFYHGVTRGVGNNQLLGDKLKWRGICIKYKLINAYFTTGFNYNTQPVVIDMYILKCPQYYTTTSLPWSVLHNDTTADPSTAFMEPGHKVLFKKTLRITPDRGSATAQQKMLVGKKWLKRNQVIQYEDFETDYKLKDNMNYYLFFINRGNNTEKSNLYFTWQNYFTDA